MSEIPTKIDLRDQWLLLLAATRDLSTTKADLAVLGEIIDRYYKSKGNSRASFDLLIDRSGVHRTTVIASLKRLVKLGYLGILTKGRRGRATEYLPNFSMGIRKGSVDTTPIDENSLGSVGTTETALLGSVGTTLLPEYGSVDTTPTYLRDRPTRDGLTLSRIEDAHGSASAGLEAATQPRDPRGFDALYTAYGLRRKRAEAKAVYENLAPDPGLHNEMVEAAGRWHSSYEENGTDIKWRKHLHSWLTKECWEEDPPVAYVDAKEAAIAKARDKPKLAVQVPVEEEETNLFKIFRITKVDEVGSWFLSNYVLTVTFEDDDGNDVVHTFRCFEKATGEDFPSHNSVAMESYSSLNAAVGGWRMAPEENVGKLVQMRAMSDELLEFLGYGDWKPIRRDATITDIRADISNGGYVVYLNFNDCEEGDKPSADIKLDCIEDLKRATGCSGRHIKGCRVYMDVYAEDDTIHEFHPHPENEQKAA